MRNKPDMNDKYDVNELAELNAAPWQIAMLARNPEYTSWGNGEDYMCEKDGGWRTPSNNESWSPWDLDDFNECVNFYFFLHRKGHACPECDGSGQNKATKRLADDWYDFAGTGRKWMYNIGPVEIEALMRLGRLRGCSGFHGYLDDATGKWMTWRDGGKVECEQPEFPTPGAVNAWARRGAGHDSINQWICVEARARSLGVYGDCEHCEGGSVYDEPTARLGLQLWMLHPRKGAARGVRFDTIEQGQIPEVLAWLRKARDRNAERFARLEDDFEPATVEELEAMR